MKSSLILAALICLFAVSAARAQTVELVDADSYPYMPEGLKSACILDQDDRADSDTCPVIKWDGYTIWAFDAVRGDAIKGLTLVAFKDGSTGLAAGQWLFPDTWGGARIDIDPTSTYVVLTDGGSDSVALFDDQAPGLQVVDQYNDLGRLLATGVCGACKLADAQLAGLELSNVDLDSSNLEGANLFETKLREANLKIVHLANADLRNADLTSAMLSGAFLEGADLSNAELSKADLTAVFFGGAMLVGANLSDAMLYEADLNGADLSRAEFGGANISDADFTDADLTGATGMDDVLWDETATYCNTTLPDGTVSNRSC